MREGGDYLGSREFLINQFSILTFRLRDMNLRQNANFWTCSNEAGLAPSQLQRENPTTKVDDYRIAHCWLVMIHLVPERQQCKDSRTGRKQNDPTRTAPRSRSWQTLVNIAIVVFFVAILQSKYTRAPKRVLG